MDAAPPGAGRTGYRLRFEGGRPEDAAAEAWVEVPGHPGLSLDLACPHPVSGPLRIRLTLPDSSPSRLELFDVVGRRLERREIGAQPRVQELEWSSPAARTPGIYLLVLEQGGARVQRRVVVLR